MWFYTQNQYFLRIIYEVYLIFVVINLDLNLSPYAEVKESADEI